MPICLKDKICLIHLDQLQVKAYSCFNFSTLQHNILWASVYTPTAQHYHKARGNIISMRTRQASPGKPCEAGEYKFSSL